jgi:hypothetical protein
LKRALLYISFLFLLSIFSFSQHAVNAIDIGSADYVGVADNGDGSLDIGDGFTYLNRARRIYNGF